MEAVSKILIMPLSFHFVEDEKFWWPDKKEILTVRLAYWLGRLRVGATQQNAFSLTYAGWWKAV